MISDFIVGGSALRPTEVKEVTGGTDDRYANPLMPVRATKRKADLMSQSASEEGKEDVISENSSQNSGPKLKRTKFSWVMVIFYSSNILICRLHQRVMKIQSSIIVK